jgi:ribonucleotide monophosphatase NagD (HAD superfamily)
VAALITRATGIASYYVGKPNPLMLRSALNAIDAHSEDAERHPYRAGRIVDSIADLMPELDG